MLKRSGYNFKFRLDIVKRVKNGFEKIIAKDTKGVKPMYRSKVWRESREMRVNKHSMKKGGVLAMTWKHNRKAHGRSNWRTQGCGTSGKEHPE